MYHTILTTRNTSKGKFIQDVIGVGIWFVILIWLSMKMAKRADELERYWRFSEAQKLGSASLALIVFAFVSSLFEFAYYFMQFKTYADVYQDRIVGKGMEKIVMQSSFDLRFDQIVDISQNNGFLGVGAAKNVFLVINTAGGSYKISTTADRAKEIMEFFRRSKQ